MNPLSLAPLSLASLPRAPFPLVRAVLAAALLALSTALPLAAAAQPQSTEVGGYLVRHSALPSEFIPPDVARLYRQPRGPNIGLLNVSLTRPGQQENFGEPVPRLTGTARNVIGHISELKFREIREGEAVYYVATFPTSRGDVLRISLELTPKGARAPLKVQFDYRP